MLVWLTLIVLVSGFIIGMAFILSSPSNGKNDKIQVRDNPNRQVDTAERHHDVPGEVLAVAANGQYAYAVENGHYQIASIASHETRMSHRIPHTAGEEELTLVLPYRLPNDKEAYASYSVDGMTRDVLPCKDYLMFTRALQDTTTKKWYGLHSNRAWLPLDGVPERALEVHLAEDLTHGVAVNHEDVVSILCRGVWTVDLRINGLAAVADNLYLADKARRVFRVTDSHDLEAVCRLHHNDHDIKMMAVHTETMQAVVVGQTSCIMYDLSDGREIRNLLTQETNILSMAWDMKRGTVYLGQTGCVTETSVE